MPYKKNNGGEMQEYSKETGEYGSGTKNSSGKTDSKKESKANVITEESNTSSKTSKEPNFKPVGTIESMMGWYYVREKDENSNKERSQRFVTKKDAEKYLKEKGIVEDSKESQANVIDEDLSGKKTDENVKEIDFKGTKNLKDIAELFYQNGIDIFDDSMSSWGKAVKLSEVFEKGGFKLSEKALKNKPSSMTEKEYVTGMMNRVQDDIRMGMLNDSFSNYIGKLEKKYKK